MRKNSWNYRVIKRKDKKLKNRPQTYYYGIYEVYYNEKGKPEMWTENPTWPIGGTLNDLVESCDMMFDAFSSKVLVEVEERLVEGDYLSNIWKK